MGFGAILGVAAVITLLGVTLVFAALRNDQAISAHLGTANAQVDQVLFDRTIIRFETPDGVAHSPENGVLYPGGLSAGQLIRIEYDTTDPELAKVAGRTWLLTLLPVGSTVLITWLIAGPLLWWLRSKLRAERRAAEPVTEAETPAPAQTP
ncbi:DUF3592 domain-containing protein [Saccharomonospora sp. NPDC006951]